MSPRATAEGALADQATVAVVGGGPAGSFLTIRLLQRVRELGRSVKVIIFEKKSEICFYKPSAFCSWEGCNYCAGGIYPRLADILGEAGLSFIGLGATNSLTWGTMLYYAQNAFALQMGAWWWFVPPGLMIALLGCGLSMINFSIDEIINPKLRDQTRSARKRWTVSKEQLKRVSVEDVP